MFDFQNFIERLFGDGDRAAAKRMPRREAMQPIPRQPMRAQAPTSDNMITNRMVQNGQLPSSRAEVYPQQFMTPAQRDFPGRTNYGVPEDNMIDTPIGYISPQAYNSLGTVNMGNPLQSTVNPQAMGLAERLRNRY